MEKFPSTEDVANWLCRPATYLTSSSQILSLMKQAKELAVDDRNISYQLFRAETHALRVVRKGHWIKNCINREGLARYANFRIAWQQLREKYRQFFSKKPPNTLRNWKIRKRYPPQCESADRICYSHDLRQLKYCQYCKFCLFSKSYYTSRADEVVEVSDRLLR